MLTTVPSMNAMLVARIVAARTQGAAAGEQGAAPCTLRAIASSQGSRLKAVMNAVVAEHWFETL
jgi:hypothetical protein